MSDSILDVLGWINDMVLGMGDKKGALVGAFSDGLPELYPHVENIMNFVVLPVAYVVLALFFILEIYRASIRVDGMGGGVANLGAEIIFRIMLRMVLCKVAVDSVPLILNAIYSLTTYLTSGVHGVMNGSGFVYGSGIDIDALRSAVEGLGFWTGLVSLILCFIVFLISLIAVGFAHIIIVTRFIELYLYYAIAPIPVATLPSDEMSSIGKNFLKSFAAVSLQGTLLFIVLSFFPVLLNGTFLSDSTDNIFLALLGVLGYSIVLVIAVFTTGRWAKSICNAM